MKRIGGSPLRLPAVIFFLVVFLPVSRQASAWAFSQDTAQNSAWSATRFRGVIKAISGREITFTTDAGTELSILVQDAAWVLRIIPGQTDLKAAVPIPLQDLQPGDRILVRGKLSADSKSLVASSLIAMREADIAGKRAQDREAWQKNGTGGLVKAVDPAAGTLTIGVSSPQGPQSMVIHVSKTTVIRRYAPDSVLFDNAGLSMLDQIHPGDQVRARGSRSAEGSEFSAEEIVSGAFRNIAGMISSVNSATNSVIIGDLATKKSMQITITPESNVRKLSPPMAQRIARHLKGISPDAASAEGVSESSVPPATHPQQRGAAGHSAPGPGSFGSNGGALDLQQAILRMPPAALADFHKGDAVLVVATQGDGDTRATAITLLGGVEPILSASPNGAAAGTLLSPWNLSSGEGGAEGTVP